MPEVYPQLLDSRCDQLEQHYRDMQDIEFTVEEGTLYMLQTRNGKRTAPAAVRIAVDMVEEGLIDREDAPCCGSTPASSISCCTRARSEHAPVDVIATRAARLPRRRRRRSRASTPTTPRARAKRGEDVILVRRETTPEDVHGMVARRAS